MTDKEGEIVFQPPRFLGRIILRKLYEELLN